MSFSGGSLSVRLWDGPLIVTVLLPHVSALQPFVNETIYAWIALSLLNPMDTSFDALLLSLVVFKEESVVMVFG